MKPAKKQNMDILKLNQQLFVKAYICGRQEHYALVDCYGNVIYSCEYELGKSVVDFIYNDIFDIAVNYLSESKDIAIAIKNDSDEDKAWSGFALLVENLLFEKSFHPFYFPLIAEIINSYKSKMCNKSGLPLTDDHFVQLGESLRQLKHSINSLLDRLDGVEDYNEILQNYKETVFSSPIAISSLQAEIIEKNTKSNTKDTLEVQMVLSPTNLQELWNYLLTVYAMSGVRFKRCENCMRFFSTTGRGNPVFCDRIIEGQGKTCRQLMPKVRFDTKAKNDPAVRLYNRAYKTMHSRIAYKTISKEMFHEWSKQARERRDACSKGDITIEEYSSWLCDNGLFIDYLKEE